MTITTSRRFVGIAGAFALGGAVLVPTAAFAATDTDTVSVTIAACTVVAASIDVGTIGTLEYDPWASSAAPDGSVVFTSQEVPLELDTGSKIGMGDCDTPTGGLFVEHTPFQTTLADETEPVVADARTGVAIGDGDALALRPGEPTLIAAGWGGAHSLLINWYTAFAPNTAPGDYSSTATFTLTLD